MASGGAYFAAGPETLTEAALQELGCTERSVSLQVLDGLSRLASHVFYTPGDEASSKEYALAALKELQLPALNEDFDGVEHFARAFAFRPGTGLPGWQRTFGPLQGCPMLFIAAELAMAVGIWVPGAGIDVHWAARFDPFEPKRTRAQRSHFARAIALADSFRSWFRNAIGGIVTAESVMRRGRLATLCGLLIRGSWQTLDLFADIALRGMGCQPLEYVRFSDLLGCQPITLDLERLCAPPTLESLHSSSTLASFWEDLSSALLLRPTLQLQWGFQAGASQAVARVMPAVAQPVAAHPGEALFFEFGVYNGSSVNYIARALQRGSAYGPARRAAPLVYGFDSFKGLPTDWRRVFGSKEEAFTAGSFRLSELPKVHPNVRLIPGWFNETIPAFLRELMPVDPGVSDSNVGGSPWARFVHIDCDLYESARQVLQSLAPFMRSGTVLVFDELVNYPEYKEGELLALFEFLQEQHWSIRVLHGPWLVANDAPEFAQLEADGVAEGDLSQAVAIELVA